MSRILSIGTAVPAHRHTQQDILQFMQKAYALQETEKRKLAFLYNHSGIDARHSVLADYGPAGGKGDFLPTDIHTSYPDIEKRQAVYDQEALPLSLNAIRDCLKDCPADLEISHLITVSCTGMSAPGLDLDIANALQLSPNLVRTSVNFMGCYAAIHALKMADWICRATPEAKVLVVSVELCTLHFQKEFTVDNATSSLLFADGAAAALISHRTENSLPGLKLTHFYSWVNAAGRNDMTWALSSQGFRMTLSSYVPHLLSTDILPVVESALLQKGYRPEDVTHWCIHPGGKRILEAIGKQLQISPQQLGEAYSVLASHGNMSSATILFVLKKMFEDLRESKEGAIIFGAAFGPGLTMETFLAETL